MSLELVLRAWRKEERQERHGQDDHCKDPEYPSPCEELRDNTSPTIASISSGAYRRYSISNNIQDQATDIPDRTKASVAERHPCQWAESISIARNVHSEGTILLSSAREERCDHHQCGRDCCGSTCESNINIACRSYRKARLTNSLQRAEYKQHRAID